MLGKLHKLLSLGWPIETLRIGTCLVEPANRKRNKDGTWETHAVLLVAVLVVNDEYVLDNRKSAVLTIAELNRAGYEPVAIQLAGGHRTFVEWFWR